MKTVKLPLSRILELNEAASLLLRKPIKSSLLSFRIGKLHSYTKVDAQTFEETRIKLVEKYGEEGENENGKSVTVKNLKAFLDELRTLKAAEEEIKIPDFKLSDFADMEIEPLFFDLMGEFIEEE